MQKKFSILVGGFFFGMVFADIIREIGKMRGCTPFTIVDILWTILFLLMIIFVGIVVYRDFEE